RFRREHDLGGGAALGKRHRNTRRLPFRPDPAPRSISRIRRGTVATHQAENCPIRMHASQVVEFEHQLAGVACTARAWAKVPVAPSAEQRRDLKAQIKRLQARSEEHTSELQSRSDIVCRLLLEKKKKT